jgi:hypothetical protein
MSQLRVAALISSIPALLVATRAEPRVWSILPDHSGDAPTIQCGIDSAGTGDTVLVHAGNYPGHIDFKGKLITVLGASGPGSTTLDGSTPTAGNVVTFQSGEGRESRLEGFTIQGGMRGIGISAAEPTIIGNIIIGNGGSFGSTLSGAGILCAGASTRLWAPLIRENDISENVATGNGGGIAIQDAMVPEVLYNTIYDNQTDQNGGGIYVQIAEGGAVLKYNVIESNVAGFQGGGIYVVGSGETPLSIDIGFSVLRQNYAHGAGMGGSIGGGAWLSNTNVIGHHLTVVENSGQSGQPGGGIVFDGAGVPHLERSIIAFNASGGGIACVGGATPIIHYSLAWQNVGGDGVGGCGIWYLSNGNLVADPLFCDLASGDVTVSVDSPALLPPGGPMGAYISPGCSGTPILPTTWGSLKARFNR